jgi:HB1, ASXL, restriction endonuclease HTH domain
MATQKNTSRDTSHQTPKGRQPKAAKADSLPAEAPAPAQPVPAEAAETPTDPTAGSSRIATPMPAQEATAAKAERPTDAAAPTDPTPQVNKLSALDAAAKVLGESGQAMNCQQLIAAMAAQGYWSSPKGRTPASTLYSALLREIQTQGANARFLKTQRGKFMLKGAL